MNSLFAKLWQLILRWAYALLGGTDAPAAQPSSIPPSEAVAKREAAASAAIAQAEAEAPRTQDELADRLAKGTF